MKNEANGDRIARAVGMMDHRVLEPTSAENEDAKVTLDSIGEGILRTDIHGNVIYLNKMAEQLIGLRRAEAIGRPVTDVVRIIDGVSRAAVTNVAEILVNEDKASPVATKCMNCLLVRRDDSECEIEVRVMPTHNQDGEITGAVVTFQDVSAARAKSLEMSHLAEHDFLTDLPNRMLFNDRLAQAIGLAVRQDKQLAVMFVDLDHFKKINDSLGHEIGDKLLKSVAMRLVSCVRRTDTVSRIGGDEFVILLSQVEHGEDAAVSAQKILRALAEPHLIDNKSLDINVSIGVSTYPVDGPNAESLMNKADTAMYEAKQLGRNNYRFYKREMHARLAERQILEKDLRYAMGRNEFLLHYQPKLNLQTGEITGVEALIRWAHPQRGMVSPAQFIPIAEECGLILTIGRWVLLEACKQARAWSDSGVGVVSMAVNVSAAEFGDKDFISGVRAALIATGVEPPNLARPSHQSWR
jgi:diguanylate cyclase (GGDEF)-like protein/PAS domain S-box-containing protein